MSEASKAFEKLLEIFDEHCETYCIERLQDEDYDQAPLIEVVRRALTRLSELEPIIQELVEARKKATQLEWVAKDEYITADDGIDLVVGECYLSAKRHDAAFIALAANRIAKIGGV